MKLSRRELLRAVVVVAGPSLGTACVDGDSADSAVVAGGHFPQSVASGDPRPHSVVLWTRVVDRAAPDAELTLELELAHDERFEDRVSLSGAASFELVALPAAGGCVKVRVEELAPGTTYYYRFVYRRGGERILSPHGRTRTAPAPDSDRPLRFAVISCQDYDGKYYHVLRHLAEQELDFVLHLGDYIYETAGDPSFQTPSATRAVRFSEPGEALVVGDGDALAARSLGNYRDLYRTYRSDPDLQRVHERFPVIAIPDDHEFSNDCHGAQATYSAGREAEEDFERRRNADRAWFEYMPVDYVEGPARALDDAASFPDDFAVHRSFVFGRVLELVLTDLRRYRPDHLIPEDAFPGAVFLTESEAEDVLGALPDDTVPYVDWEADLQDEQRTALSAGAEARGFDASRLSGPLSVPWLDSLLDAPLLAATSGDRRRGYAYHQLYKNDEFSSLGARYFVAERPFHALARARSAATSGASERLMGDAQRRWFVETLKASERIWKVWGNEYTLMQRVIDLREVELAAPEFRKRIVLNVDDWDGAPNERDALLSELAEVENIVVFTGDLHAFFAGTPHASSDESARVVEFVSGSVSSTTWLTAIERALADEPSLPPGTALLASLVGTLLSDDDARPNPHIGYLDLRRNGYAAVTATPEALEASFFLIDDLRVLEPPSALPALLAELFETVEFRVPAGSRELERRIDGEWKRWDRAALAYR